MPFGCEGNATHPSQTALRVGRPKSQKQIAATIAESAKSAAAGRRRAIGSMRERYDGNFSG
jgi:hypothetical protein